MLHQSDCVSEYIPNSKADAEIQISSTEQLTSAQKEMLIAFEALFTIYITCIINTHLTNIQI